MSKESDRIPESSHRYLDDPIRILIESTNHIVLLFAEDVSVFLVVVSSWMRTILFLFNSI